jgi:hypothetical protein
LLIVFAVIGVLVVIAVLGMVFMHAGMMHSFGNMMSACLGRMRR